jgi:hypothetical protein
MTAAHRRKGILYENELCHRFRDEFGFPVRRLLSASRDGGCDIEIGKFILEAKRRSEIAQYEWYSQAKLAAKQPGQVPVVIMRADGEESLVVLSLDDFIPLMRGELGK